MKVYPKNSRRYNYVQDKKSCSSMSRVEHVCLLVFLITFSFLKDSVVEVFGLSKEVVGQADASITRVNQPVCLHTSKHWPIGH